MPYKPTDLLPGAAACVQAFARVRDDDRVLVLSDNATVAEALVQAIHDGGASRGASVDVFYLTSPSRPVGGVSPVLAAARDAATVVFNVLTEYDSYHSYFHDEHEFRRGLVAVDRGSQLRVFHMLGVSEHAFTKTGVLAQDEAEIEEMEELTHRLAIALTLARRVVVRSGGDAELAIDAGGTDNVALVSSGRLQPGTWGNLPSGEAFLLPVAASGSLVVDKAVAGLKPSFHPFRLSVTDSRVTLSDDAPNELREVVSRDEKDARAAQQPPENVRTVCEFGVGTNPRAGADSFIEIEKIRGTIHVAIGRNDGFGGQIVAPGHIDMVVGSPTVILDDKFTILSNGSLHEEALVDFMRPTHTACPVLPRPHATIVDRFVDSVVDDGDRLVRRWVDPRKNRLDASLGYEATARAARHLWTCFDDRPSREIGQLIKLYEQRFNGSHEDTLRLLTVLERFGTIAFRDPPPPIKSGV